MVSNAKGKFADIKLSDDEDQLSTGLKAFYKEVRKIPLLTREEELEIGNRIVNATISKKIFEEKFPTDGAEKFKWLLENKFLDKVSDEEGRPKAITDEKIETLAKKYSGQGTILKIKISEICPNGNAILSQLIEKNVVEDLSPTEIRLKPNLDRKRKMVMDIAKEDFDKIWDVLQRSRQYKIILDILQQFNREAVHKLVRHNLRLVIRIAIQIIKKKDVDRRFKEEMIDAGCRGLFRAAQSFIPSKGKGFAYYAGKYIESEILRELSMLENSMVKAPENERRLLSKYKKFIYEYAQKHKGEYPTNEQIAKNLKVSIDKVVQIRQSSIKNVRIEPSEKPEEESARNTVYADTLEDEDVPAIHEVVSFINKDIAQKILKDLTPKEMEIIKLRFGLIKENEKCIDPYIDEKGKFNPGTFIHYTPAMLAKKYGCSRQWIRKLEDRIMEKMKKVLMESMTKKTNEAPPKIKGFPQFPKIG